MNQLGGNYDAFSVHAYFALEPLPTNDTTDQYIAALQASIPTTLNQLRTARAMADQASTQIGRHIGPVAYEGGPGMEAQFLPANDSTQTQDTLALNQASIDPRIYGIYSSFLNQLSTTGLDLLDNFEYTARVALNSLGGEYGALTYQDQPTGAAPRYHALLDYVNATRVSVGNFVIGLDNQVYAQKLDAQGNPVGGYYLTQPGQVKALAAGTDGLGHAELWVIGLDDQVWAQTFDAAGNPSGPYFLTQPGRVQSIAVGQAGGDPELFATGLDNQVWAQTFDLFGRSTSSYVLTQLGRVKATALGKLGGGFSGAPELFVIGLDDQVYAQTFDASGQSTSSYFLTAAGRVKSLSVGALGTAPEVFVTGLDDQVYAQLLTAGGAGGISSRSPIRSKRSVWATWARPPRCSSSAWMTRSTHRPSRRPGAPPVLISWSRWAGSWRSVREPRTANPRYSPWGWTARSTPRRRISRDRAWAGTSFSVSARFRRSPLRTS